MWEGNKILKWNKFIVPNVSDLPSFPDTHLSLFLLTSMGAVLDHSLSAFPISAVQYKVLYSTMNEGCQQLTVIFSHCFPRTGTRDDSSQPNSQMCLYKTLRYLKLITSSSEPSLVPSPITPKVQFRYWQTKTSTAPVPCTVNSCISCYSGDCMRQWNKAP